MCLLLSLLVIVLGVTNRRILGDLQLKQQEIEKGAISKKVGQRIVNELAEISVENTKIKSLLLRNGIEVSVIDDSKERGIE